jgi:hypothetical protein
VTHTLVYVVVGNGFFRNQMLFSAYSARRQERREGEPCTIALYSTAVLELPDELQIDLRLISPEDYEAWSAEGSAFSHRATVCALQDALARTSAPCIYVDGDTYFTKSPAALLARLKDQQTLMHVDEGAMGALWREYVGAEYQDASGTKGRIDARDRMWNAGVVGVTPADAHLLRDVLAVHDALVADGFPAMSQQVAAAQVLTKRTQVKKAADVIYHYWGTGFRKRWAPILGMLMVRAQELPREERADFLYSYRPRLTLRQNARHLVKRPLQRIGVVPCTEISNHHALTPALPRGIV